MSQNSGEIILFELVRIRLIQLNRNNGEIKSYIKLLSFNLLIYKNMEFTAESSLLKAQHLLVQFLCEKSYYKDKTNINYKLYNAQLLLNQYVTNQHQLMFDNYKYIEEKKENNDNSLNNEKIEEYKDDTKENYDVNFPALIRDPSFKPSTFFNNRYFSNKD